MISRQKGFTLAEVLVTLAIIGVVAALTIPSLMTRVQDQQYKSAYKEIYSTITRATKLIVEDNGGSIMNLCPNQDSNCLLNKYLGYLNVAKSCTAWNAKNDGCWHQDGVTKLLNGTSYNEIDASTGIVLNNGVIMLVDWNYQYCDNGSSNQHYCGNIRVDVNGFKPPNTVGKDIYRINLDRYPITQPDGAPDTWSVPPNSTCIEGSTAAENDGWYCSKVRLLE